MSRQVFFGKNDLRFYFYRYKDSKYFSISLTIISIFVCLLLIFKVIIPQAQSYFSIAREVEAQKQRLAALNRNIEFMNNLDKSQLELQFQTSVQALPIEKDFVAVLNLLSETAVRSGVTLNDFTFNVDKVNSTGPKTSLDLVIKVNGNIDRVKIFMKEVHEKLPIAEIVDINNNLNATFISLKFYYKTYPKLDFNEDELISPISDSDLALIDKLTSWKLTNINFPDEALNPISSTSAVPLFD